MNKVDAEHLKVALKKQYPMTVDWSGEKHIVITLNWNYSKQEMRPSMPGHVKKN